MDNPGQSITFTTWYNACMVNLRTVCELFDTRANSVPKKEGVWPGDEAIEHESRYYYRIVSDLVYTIITRHAQYRNANMEKHC